MIHPVTVHIRRRCPSGLVRRREYRAAVAVFDEEEAPRMVCVGALLWEHEVFCLHDLHVGVFRWFRLGSSVFPRRHVNHHPQIPQEASSQRLTELWVLTKLQQLSEERPRYRRQLMGASFPPQGEMLPDRAESARFLLTFQMWQMCVSKRSTHDHVAASYIVSDPLPPQRYDACCIAVSLDPSVAVYMSMACPDGQETALREDI